MVDDGQHIRLSPSTPLAELHLGSFPATMPTVVQARQAFGAIPAQGSYLLWA